MRRFTQKEFLVLYSVSRKLSDNPNIVSVEHLISVYKMMLISLLKQHPHDEFVTLKIEQVDLLEAKMNTVTSEDINCQLQNIMEDVLQTVYAVMSFPSITMN